MIPLCNLRILSAYKRCQTQVSAPETVEIICLDTIDSTNAFLKKHIPTQPLTLCCAEAQTAGRGRRGRHWASPYGKNLYVSLRLQITRSLANLQHLSLIVGLACLSAFEHLPLPHPMKIKWPNDLMVNGKKLGGILIEILNAQNNQTEVVIGIGINVNQTPSLANDDRVITSLFELTQQNYDRNVCIGHLLYTLLNFIRSYEHEGWQGFQHHWSQVDALFGKRVEIYHANRLIKGLGQGVNDKAQLIILDDEARLHTISSGEIIM